MIRLEKQFDIPTPLQDVEAQWQRVKARRNAEVDQVAGDLRGTGLSRAAAAGNPGSRGAAPGPGGGKPGTT